MLKQKILNKEKLIGMYVQLADVSIARIAGLAGYDFVWVDTEHSYMSHETLLSHVLAIQATGTPVIVRAPQDDLTATKHILEMGVDGIIFPMVHNAEEARRLTDYALYPPRGARGFGPMNAINYGFSNAKEYMLHAHERLCVFIQIEHKDAIEHLDEIMQNPYIDGYVFGPNDLAASYGLSGEPFSDFITDVMKQTIQKLHANDKYVAIASGGYSDEVLAHWSQFGADMLSAGADFDFLRDGALRNRINMERIHKNK
jgi:2-keto-3-deoxy-L-rhamnonate aldolase RhmA